ncbi:hypothetical protein M7I_5784 [Glarea lozoyensis 74030]|uniref:Uncharacterized protein n=1 Tax=Glarea lozoyensis (strain ATCC 74030 / MF5533) TaxID=1104152 RepID=H0EST7_GLAL7|nr:hypothetical protein M7I_5784 [Glarea lozoyensis 74030]
MTCSPHRTLFRASFQAYETLPTELYWPSAIGVYGQRIISNIDGSTPFGPFVMEFASPQIHTVFVRSA